MLLVSFLAGCVSEKELKKPAISSEGGTGNIDEVNVLAVPVALDLDQVPGPDGFVIKVYAGSRKRPKPFGIDDGKLEVLMFDGLPGEASAAAKSSWSYTAEELRKFEIRTSIGVGYQITLQWGKNKPTHDKFTILVIYFPSKGRPIRSAPSIIAAR